LSEHIRTMRLLRAAEALDDPRRAHQTITQIAHEAGFGGPTQLSRRFRAAYGCTPSEYRQRS
ncbi:MAG: helix-turn-helix domain-containing protein, partial [Actinomycetota bacterium]